MDCLDDDAVGLLCKRVYDIAGCCNSYSGARLQVHLNGKKLPVKSFQQYVSLYDGLEAPVAFEKVNDRWEVGVGPSDGQFMQVSFVNSICTVKGGQHANFVADKVCQKLAAVVKRKNKGEEVKAHFIKNHLAVYVNCLIENPAFDSQTKEVLTTRSSAFGSDAKIGDKFFKAVEKSGIIDRVLSWAKFKQNEQLKRKGGSKRSKLSGVTKLDDANFAGTAKGKDATLILTEGDSAKSLAVSGLSIVGRDYYGVFPLKGKLLNVREASHSQIMKNEEIQNICKILGLRHGVEYPDASSLRYGHLMIMADQDHDGSHIKGLLINFIHHFWPSLMNVPGFVQQFITPIVRVTKGSKSQNFFTIPEYEQWKEATNDGKGWSIKYYKGLGTSTAKDAKEYFADLETHRIDFETLADATDGDIIDMAFSKKRVQDRKTWLTDFEPGTFVDYSVDHMTYKDFVNRELVLFSMADNERSIPSIMDGFKPSQRKVLFACFKRKLKSEIKVAQLAGYVSEHAAYHHGEMSLNSTIVNMAQDFVGSNNVNLLVPSGQFGTRLQGGKDAASPRYIFTCLEAVARSLFHPEDDQLLKFLDDDGQSIEPSFYLPVLPMILVNGADGIGTGWSTFVPNFNPQEVIECLRAMLNAEEDDDEVELNELHPWYRGFGGEIEAKTGKDKGSYVVRGAFEEVDENTIKITELPVRTWTQGYKQFLESMLSGAPDSKDAGLVKDFRENHTDRQVHFTVTFADGVLASIKAAPGGVLKKLKLETTISTSNMHLFDANGQIKRYSAATQVIREYFPHRLALYASRKEAMLRKMEAEHSKLSNQVRFILAVISGELVVSNRPKRELLAELQAQKYSLVANAQKRDDAVMDEDEDDDAEQSQGDLSKGYDYLLSMKLWNLTLEKVEDLRAQLLAKEEELEALRETTHQQMWLTDLDSVEQSIAIMEQTHADNAADEERTRRKAQGKGGKGKKAPKKAKKKAASRKASYDSDDESEDDFDDSDDDSDYDVPKKTKKKTTSRAAAAPKSGRTSAAAVPATSTTAVAATKDKPVAAKKKAKAAPKALVPPVIQPEESPEDSDSDDGVEILSLADRMKKHMSMASSAVASSSNEDDDIFGGAEADDDDDDDDDFEVTTKSTQPKTKKAATKGVKRAQKSRAVTSSVAAVFSPGQPSPEMKKSKKTTAKPTAKAKAKPTAKPAAKRQPKKKDVDSSDEDSDMEDVVESVSKTPKPTRQRNAVVYADDDSDFDYNDDSEEDNFDDEEEEAADSEYED